MDIRFCFRIASAAEMAHDENGAPAEAFAQVLLGGANKSPADYDAAHQKIGNTLAFQIGVKPDWVIPISPEEYDRENTEKDLPYD